MSGDFVAVKPQCRLCQHLTERGPFRYCPAFPGGITRDVWDNKVDHAVPYPNQEGETVFASRPGAPPADLALLAVVLADTPQGRQRAVDAQVQTIEGVLGLKKPGILKGKS